MKKIHLLFIILLIKQVAFAQEPADALRYSWTVPKGTAREQAIGGAMGSLGGDITAAFVNPAGLAFFKTGDIVFSPVYSFGNNKSSYLSHNEQDKYNRFTWGTTGFAIGSGPSNKIRNSTFALVYNRMADFNSNLLYRGSNNQSSYSQKFLEEIQNNNLKDPNQVATNYPFGTSLAFNTFWIDTVAGGTANNYEFKSRAPIASGLLQQNTIETHGGIDEIALAYAINKNDKFMIGGTLGIPILHYTRDGEFIEADATDNAHNNFNYAQIKESLRTNGIGANIKIGAIYKLENLFRIGLAFHSPTIYQLTDSYSASVTTDTEDYKGIQTQTSTDVSGATSDFKYMLITPYKVTASLSYVMRETQDVSQQKGFLTADIEYVNYKSASFKPDQSNNNDQSTIDYLNQLNTAIKKAYKGTFNFRIGGELKFTTLMARAGFAYYSNPYKNINGENGNHMSISGGIGYRNKGLFIDLTYVQYLNKDTHFAYRLSNASYFPAYIHNSTGNILLTFGVKI